MKWEFRAIGMALALGAAILVSPLAVAHEDHGGATPIKRSLVKLQIPTVTLVREDGVKIDLSQELKDPHPVYLNFIFTSCTTVCPVMTQIFAKLQDKLGADREHVRLISVSIDPEHDTPSLLAAYARDFDAGPQWRFYTGTNEASITVQQAFGVLGVDKMNHRVATFYRGAPGQSWVRIDGFAGPEMLAAEYRREKSGS
jgi:protein SCO1/2